MWKHFTWKKCGVMSQMSFILKFSASQAETNPQTFFSQFNQGGKVN